MAFCLSVIAAVGTLPPAFAAGQTDTYSWQALTGAFSSNRTSAGNSDGTPNYYIPMGTPAGQSEQPSLSVIEGGAVYAKHGLKGTWVGEATKASQLAAAG
jgi:hypothetical protein